MKLIKFTSEDLMEWLGLQVGDEIRINDKPDNYIVELNECGIPCVKDKYTKIRFEMTYLINRKVEILPRPKRVGDLKCSYDDTLNCSKCPLFVLCHASREYDNKRLYEVLDNWFESSKDQEIYYLLKTRLDKEVEVNE